MPKWNVPTPPPEKLKGQPHRIGIYYLEADAAGDYNLCDDIWGTYGAYLLTKISMPTTPGFQGSWNHGICAASACMIHSWRMHGPRTDIERSIVDYCAGQLTGNLGWWGRECFSETYALVLAVYAYLYDWAERNKRNTLGNWTGKLARANAAMFRLFAIPVSHPDCESDDVFILSPKVRTDIHRAGGSSLSYYLERTHMPGGSKIPHPNDWHYGHWRINWSASHGYVDDLDFISVVKVEDSIIGGVVITEMSVLQTSVRVVPINLKTVIDILQSLKVRTTPTLTFIANPQGAFSLMDRNPNGNTAPVMGCSYMPADGQDRYKDLINHVDPYRGGGGKKLGTTKGYYDGATHALVCTVEGAKPPPGKEVLELNSIPTPRSEGEMVVTIGKDGVKVA